MSEVEKYLIVDEEPFYENQYGEKKFRGVNKFYGDTLRNDKALEQAKRKAVDPGVVYKYVNEILELFRRENGFTEPKSKNGRLLLDGTEQEVLNNGIIVKGCKWEAPLYSKELHCYTKWDLKYDEIAKFFYLAKPSDIVWLKFTTSKHLGVVAKNIDVNYEYSVSSGKLVSEVGEKWDDSFVYIFPLTREILGKYSSGDLELAIGNYLIEKGVPIIDYYSHNN